MSSADQGYLDPTRGLTQAQIDAMIGVDPSAYAQQPAPAPETFSGGANPGFAERFGAAYDPNSIPADGLLGGFLSGLAGGIAKRGQRTAAAREKFNAELKDRQRERDKANLEATKALREARQHGMAAIAGEARASLRKDAQENVMVTADLKRQFPALVNVAEGTSIPKETLQKAAGAALVIPETPAEKRAAAAAQRAADAADRATQAQERANRMALVQSENQLVGEYRQDPAIKGYQNIRSNFQTAREAAKQNNGIGDKAIVFAFMRSLEPENPNAVREGEAQSAQDAVGLLQSYQTTLKRFLKGDRFTPEGRKKVLDMIESNLRSRRETFDEANKQYEDRAKRWQVPPEGFIRSFPQDTASVRPSAGGPGAYAPGGDFDSDRPGAR